MNNFDNKKIGIWGFGVVGSSALTFFDQCNVTSIEILNNKPVELSRTRNIVFATLQAPTTIHNFFENNDLILVSPGIPLHEYQSYAHKLISELDLFYHHNSSPTIAITGSLGKTSITHLLTNILQKMNLHTIAAGNIGYPMLQLISKHQAKNFDTIVLELSSFQLQQSQIFSPDLAIITNIYDNHLDHHASIDEYIDAKFNIIKHQNSLKKALMPLELASLVHAKFLDHDHIIFFSANKPTQEQLSKLAPDTSIYYVDKKSIYKMVNQITTLLLTISQLPPITFQTNFLIIVAALDIQNISVQSVANILAQLDIPDHRLQKIASHHGSDFYNDSKSTVWQATLQAVNSMPHDKPIKLFLGGLSKGANREPLLQALQNKNIEVYAFGKEAELLGAICKKFNIAYAAHDTLEDSFDACVKNITQPSTILFSPAGSSYDLFDNYIDRGKKFVNMVKNYTKNIS